MQFFINGILLGLTLAILVGPIIFALVQTGIERGFRAGAVMATGVWVSDFLYISAAYFGISYVMAATEWVGFEQVLGTAGGLLLIAFGVSAFFSKPPKLPNENKPAEEIIDEQLPEILDFDDDDGVNRPGYFSLWLKGFLINTVNPFTIFFWTGVTGTMAAGSEMTDQNALLFFGGIFITIMITDLLKVWAAKSVRHLLKPDTILKLRQISGAALVLFGIALFVRVFFT